MNRLNEMYKTFESSTQYYYFTDEILNAIDNNKEAFKWFSDWVYSEGPASDDRYTPDDTPHDYITKDKFYADEIEKVTKHFVKKKWSTANEEDKKLPKPKYPMGTLITITDFGSEAEPRKAMWNGSRAEIREITPEGNYKVSITDVKDSQVLFSNKWVGREPEALKQRLTLGPDMFKTQKELEDEAAKAEEDAVKEKEQAKAKADKEKEQAKAKGKE